MAARTLTQYAKLTPPGEGQTDGERASRINDAMNEAFPNGVPDARTASPEEKAKIAAVLKKAEEQQPGTAPEARAPNTIPAEGKPTQLAQANTGTSTDAAPPIAPRNGRSVADALLHLFNEKRQDHRSRAQQGARRLSAR
jgi:hypothetical protein